MYNKIMKTKVCAILTALFIECLLITGCASTDSGEKSKDLQQKIAQHKLSQDRQKQNVNFDHERSRNAERIFSRMLARSRERQNTHGY